MNHAHLPPVKQQQGFSLIIVLLVLASMMFIALGISQSTQNTTLRAGNFAYREGAQHASEAGYNAAWSAIKNTSFDDNQTGLAWYHPVSASIDTIQAPKTLVNTGTTTTSVATANGSYNVSYRVDRLCTSAVDTTDIDAVRANCISYTYTSLVDGSENFIIAFVISVQVTAPKDSTAYYQWVVYR